MQPIASVPTSHIQDQGVFVGLVALLIWAPVPFGSLRAWSVGILFLWCLLLGCATAWAWRSRPDLLAQRLSCFRIPLSLLIAFAAFPWLQAMPMPTTVVQLLSPAAVIDAAAPYSTLSVDPYESRTMGMLSMTMVLAFGVTLLTVRTQERMEQLTKALIFSGLLQAILGAVLFSVKADYQIFFIGALHDRMYGTFDYHNTMAAYMCMTLSLGIGLMLAKIGRTDAKVRARNWKGKAAAALEFALSPTMRLRLLLVVMVIALVLTRSRMGNTAFFVSMVVVGLYAIVVARKTAPHTMALIISLIVMDIVIVGTGVGLEKVVQRIQDTELRIADAGKAESIEARTAAARMSLPILQDYPLVGSGAGSFYSVFMTYREPDYGYAYVHHTHNDFVEIATDYGLLGLGLVGALALLTARTTAGVMAQRRSKLPWGIAFGVTMAIVALFIHSTVDFNLQIPAISLTITVILAMGWCTRELPSRRDKQELSL